MKCWFTLLLILIIIGIIVWIIFNQIHEYYDQTDPMLIQLREKLKPMAQYPEYKELIENMKLYKGNKSYTINKDKIYLCLYDDKKEYYSLNMLTFVLLHELSHAYNKKDVGHTEEFHRVFGEILNKAIQKNVYNANEPLIQDYCSNGSGK